VGTVERIGVAGVVKPAVTTDCRLTVAYCAESMKLIRDWLTSNCCCCCCCCCCWCCDCDFCCCCLPSTDVMDFDITELLAEAAFDCDPCVMCDCGELRKETDSEDALELLPRCRILEASDIDFDVFDDLFGHCVKGVWQDVVTYENTEICHALSMRREKPDKQK